MNFKEALQPERPIAEQPKDQQGKVDDMPRKRCFVISPIGAEGSPVREHANDVYDYIIKPAMEACDIDAFRSDHLLEPGKISEQMFGAILKEDLCIAVLTGYNPNVFYELAIAQCAKRPVIILLEKGEQLPFDIRDLRCVYYDLKPRALFDKVYVNEIAGHVKSLEATNWEGSSPIAALFSGREVSGQNIKFFPKSMEYGTQETWLELLREAGTVFEIMGLALGTWKRGKNFSRELEQKARQGCAIRIMLMDSRNPALPELINRLIPEVSLDGVLHEIDDMGKFFAGLASSSENLRVRQLLHGCPHFFLARSDSRAVFIQYLYSERSEYSPLWECTPSSPLYALMTQEFESLWQANAVE